LFFPKKLSMSEFCEAVRVMLYSDRSREFVPLTDTERYDFLRAAIGYSLADEALSLARLRERYAPKMANTPDRHAFDIVTAPSGTTGAECADLAKTIASLSTLDAFLRDMKQGYPESGAASPEAAASPAPSNAPAAKPPKADTPIGSISRAPINQR
jgi:hypothetical protein